MPTSEATSSPSDGPDHERFQHDDDVASAGGVVWRTHPFGYLLRRTTGCHTWSVDERYFERQAEQRWDGLALDVAGVCEVDGPRSG